MKLHLKNNISIIQLLIVICTISILSCSKDLVLTESNTPELILKAKEYYDKKNHKHNEVTSLEGDTIDLFEGLDVDWEEATIETSLSNEKYVKGPLFMPDSLLDDSISADLIFYDGLCGYEMELWIFPKSNSIINNDKTKIQNGWVTVCNECSRIPYFFSIENSNINLIDTIDIFSNTSNLLSIRKFWPRLFRERIKCPGFGSSDNIWDDIGDWFDNAFNKSKSKKGKSSGSGNSGSGNNNGSGIIILNWSGYGGWGNSSEGTTWTLSGGEGINQKKVTESNNRRLTSNKIILCLMSNTENGQRTFNGTKNVLSNIIGHCQMLPNGAIDALTNILLRKNETEWPLLIESFLISNGFSQTCLKTIFDAQNCINNSPRQFEIDFKNNYGIDIWNEYPDFMEECFGASDQEACMYKKIFKISDSHYTCIANSPELKIQIAELINSNITDPCRPEKTSSELINEILDKICNSPENKFNLFTDELEKSDWIQFYNNFLDNPRLKCIMKKIISSNNNLYCTTLENFDGVSSISVRFSYTSFKNVDGSNNTTKDGATQFPDENGQILIQLNSNSLEVDGDWNVVQTILHEGIHANIAKIFFDYSSSQIEQNYPLMFSYFQVYKNTTWEWEHEYMANEMIDELITSLKDVFGTNYTDEEYEYMAWEGLKNTDKWVNHTNTTEQNRINSHKTSIDSKNVKICP